MVIFDPMFLPALQFGYDNKKEMKSFLTTVDSKELWTMLTRYGVQFFAYIMIFKLDVFSYLQWKGKDLKIEKKNDISNFDNWGTKDVKAVLT